MEKISRYLEHQDESVSRNIIFSSVGGKRASVLQATTYLIQDGHATETNHGIALTLKYREPEIQPEGTGTPVPGGTQVVPGTTGTPVPPLTGGPAPVPPQNHPQNGGTGTHHQHDPNWPSPTLSIPGPDDPITL